MTRPRDTEPAATPAREPARSGERADLVVRPLAPGEESEVGALLLAAYAAGGHLRSDPGYGVHVADVAGRSVANTVLVAERDGMLVGSVTITPHGSPDSADAGPDEAEFRFLGVAEQAWGTGVAEALVDACEQWAAAHGLARIVISVIDWNEPGLRLYRRLGFTRAPERDRTPAPGIVLCALVRPVGLGRS